MKDILEIVKSGLFIKGVTQKIENETKKQKSVFPCMLLGTLSHTLLKNMLSGLTEKGAIRAVVESGNQKNSKQIFL